MVQAENGLLPATAIGISDQLKYTPDYFFTNTPPLDRKRPRTGDILTAANIKIE